MIYIFEEKLITKKSGDRLLLLIYLETNKLNDAIVFSTTNYKQQQQKEINKSEFK